MTSKLGPNVFGFKVVANLERRRAMHGGPKANTSSRQRSDLRLVTVEEVLFAEMDDLGLAEAFSDDEIGRLAATFGLSPEEVAELYPRIPLKPAATAALNRRRGRSTRAR